MPPDTFLVEKLVIRPGKHHALLLKAWQHGDLDKLHGGLPVTPRSVSPEATHTTSLRLPWRRPSRTLV